jgi:UDP-GlcNAc:undecaprenyl-phosphate/decaprenyl-phosphate GlcNAc-1-phosphate transferase
MLSYLLLFCGTFLLTLLFTPLVKRLAVRWRAFDHPDTPRRVHQTPMPRLGGVAIYAAVTWAWGVWAWFTPGRLGGNLLLAATPIFVLGVLDDLRGVSERWKLVIPAFSAVLLYTLDWRITGLSFGLGLAFGLPDWVGLLLLLLWLAGMTNAFNLIDGVDGLAVGISAIAVSAVLVNAVWQGNHESGLVAATLLGALLGFLPYNFNPASIFLGDSGSLWLGFLTAGLAFSGTSPRAGTASVVAPVILGLPIIEAVVTLLRRWQAGQPLLPGDRGHFHHKLLDRGLSQRHIVLRLYGVSAILAVSGLLLHNASTPLTFFILILLGVGIVWGVRSLRYVEFKRN